MSYLSCLSTRLLATASCALFATAAFAQTAAPADAKAAEPARPYTLTANVGIYSQYISFAGGWTVGGYWTDTNNNASVYTLGGKNIGRSTGTAFIQKTF